MPLRSYIIRETLVFDDELHPNVSPYDVIWPISVLDAIVDQNTPDRVTLRTILDRIMKRVEEGPEDQEINFPVRSVRGFVHESDPLAPEYLGDVIITRESLDLENVDNTSDVNKPLSLPQKSWVETYVAQQLDAYPWPGLSSLSSHLANFSNPHKVTIGQLDTAGDVTNMINFLVGEHSTSGSSHADLRSAIDTLISSVSDLSTTLTTSLTNLNDGLLLHANNGGSNHIDYFNAMENKLNKVAYFNSPYVSGPGINIVDLDNVHYPSTLATANYIEERLQLLGGAGANATGITDIGVRDNEAALPPANVSANLSAYLLRTTTTWPGFTGIAVCKEIGGSYQWVTERFTSTGGISSIEFGVDLTIVPSIGNVRTLYYTLNGSPGSKTNIVTFGTLAFMDYIDGSDIAGGSINSSHIQNDQVWNQHIADGQITTGKLLDRSVSGVKIALAAMRAEHFLTDGTTDIYGGLPASKAISGQNIMLNQVGNLHLAKVDTGTVKGRLSTGNGDVEDIPVPELKKIPTGSSWPTSLSSYPIGSTFLNGADFGIRTSGSNWNVYSPSSTATVVATT